MFCQGCIAETRVGSLNLSYFSLPLLFFLVFHRHCVPLTASANNASSALFSFLLLFLSTPSTFHPQYFTFLYTYIYIYNRGLKPPYLLKKYAYTDSQNLFHHPFIFSALLLSSYQGTF